MNKTEDVKQLFKMVLVNRRLDVIPILCDALEESYNDASKLRLAYSKWESGAGYWTRKPEVRGRRSRWEQVAYWDMWLWKEVRKFFGSKKKTPPVKSFYRKPLTIS